MQADEERDPASAEEPKPGRHSAPEGAEVHPLIDLDRDPNPGKADHAAPDEE
jgi:hypothetical protein